MVHWMKGCHLHNFSITPWEPLSDLSTQATNWKEKKDNEHNNLYNYVKDKKKTSKKNMEKVERWSMYQKEPNANTD